MADQEQTRFRSFAERYVIERASGFKSDTDAWTAVQDAMRVYKMIEQQSVCVSRQLSPTEADSQHAGVQTAPGLQAPRGDRPVACFLLALRQFFGL